MPPGLVPLLTLPIFVVMMDGWVMTAMLPEIADDPGSSVSAAGIALTTYLLAHGIFQLAYGHLSPTVSGPFAYRRRSRDGRFELWQPLVR